MPKNYNGGHIKLQANRFVKDFKNGLNGVRVRTFYVDSDFKPEPQEKKYVAKDFISDMGIADNNRNKTSYMRKIELKRQRMEAEENGNPFVPAAGFEVKSRITEDHDYSVAE